MVLNPQATDDEAEAIVERISNFITERGGTVTERENWGLRRLAYPIQRFQEGNYVLERFTSDPQSVVDLDRTLNASEDVIRHLVMRNDN
jgi:small subunit ribosomal protein S6